MRCSNDPRFNDFDCNDRGCVDGCDCPECMPEGCMDETPPVVAAAPAAPVASWFLRPVAQYAAARPF
ncbi:MAG: hypothetical protein EKK55_07040 [Rhodocyclaceae bacterium]|nr:MAG: hypothetical protein EKK55_07040 [Rhodocyclaceae bacterium]